MVNYQNGKIYKIVNSENDMIYIGSTTQTLSIRIGKHRAQAKRNKRQSNFYRAMRTIGIDKFLILLIELYPCNSKNELEAREYEIMNTFDKSKLYNSTFDGKPSEETKQKLSEKLKGHIVTEEAKQKMSKKLKGNEKIIGKNNSQFNFGSVSFDKFGNRWRFQWKDNFKKSFSCKKYGDATAKWLAEQYRSVVYPELEEQVMLLPIYFD